MKKVIIGLLGESQTGKDWLGKIIISNLNKNYNSSGAIKAADILKLEAEKRYPDIFSIEDWENLGDSYRESVVKSIGKSRRKILQDVGTELMEENPNYVYDYLVKSIKNSTSELVLVTDIRNTLESKAIKDSGGIIIKVTRGLDLRYPKLWKKYINTSDGIYPTSVGFKAYIENRYSSIYEKLTHPTETSVDKVPDKFINFKFSNNEKNLRKLSSIILKLKAL